MYICVFCSSSNALAEIYFEQARDLGKQIGEGCHTLVYGGANVGLMQAVAQSAKEAGGQSIGIIPELIHNKRLSSSTDSEQIITPNMRDRKYLMRKRSDAFIALPGGFGTLEEILEVITLKQLHYHQKPIVFINTNGFYNPLLDQFERCYSESFSKLAYKSLYYIAANCSDAMNYISNYKHEELTAKWFDVPQTPRL